MTSPKIRKSCGLYHRDPWWGALLFLIYIIPLAQLIRSYGLNNHGYADDTQLCLSFKKTSDNSNLEKCLCDISVWMSQNKLKLTNDKTEIIRPSWTEHCHSLKRGLMCPLHLSLCEIWELCLTLNWSWHPMSKVLSKKSSFHLRNIGKARRVLTEDATKTVMQSLVMSRLDYCNALLIGIQQDWIAKLQRLQN